jgi:hypothetical protein
MEAVDLTTAWRSRYAPTTGATTARVAAVADFTAEAMALAWVAEKDIGFVVEIVAAAGEEGVEVGTIRDAKLVIAVALLRISGLVDTGADGRMRLSSSARARIEAARTARLH